MHGSDVLSLGSMGGGGAHSNREYSGSLRHVSTSTSTSVRCVAATRTRLLVLTYVPQLRSDNSYDAYNRGRSIRRVSIELVSVNVMMC